MKNFKNSNINHKIIVKNNYNFNFFNEIFLWLSGLQEDEPMPLEVKYVYFILEFKQNDIALSYSGDENKLQFFDYGFYSPLEGQYFNSYNLKQISKDFFTRKKSISKTDIFNMLKTACFKASQQLWFTKDKTVFFGYRFNKLFNKYTN